MYTTIYGRIVVCYILEPRRGVSVVVLDELRGGQHCLTEEGDGTHNLYEEPVLHEEVHEGRADG